MDTTEYDGQQQKISPPPPAPAPVVQKNWAGHPYSTNSQCGPVNGNTACPPGTCCSLSGWCGGLNDIHCSLVHMDTTEFDGQK